ncbi:hypothetical protein [Dankookia sp. P2]|uniref:hypothetical protein n=1 Tax=Dankookia sp. P2 TaxID=3423955 RepID=UPI003D67EAFA
MIFASLESVKCCSRSIDVVLTPLSERQQGSSPAVAAGARRDAAATEEKQMRITQGAIRSWRRGTRDGLAGRRTARRRAGMAARLILSWMLVAALPRYGAAAAAPLDDGAVIAFCRLLAAAGQPPASSLCICSVEQVECALTSGEFLGHVAALRAAGALGAAEFAAAVSQAQRACAPSAASLSAGRDAGAPAPGPWAGDPPAHAQRAGRQ